MLSQMLNSNLIAFKFAQQLIRPLASGITQHQLVGVPLQCSRKGVGYTSDSVLPEELQVSSKAASSCKLGQKSTSVVLIKYF